MKESSKPKVENGAKPKAKKKPSNQVKATLARLRKGAVDRSSGGDHGLDEFYINEKVHSYQFNLSDKLEDERRLKAGRPALAFSKEALESITHLASIGQTKDDISRHIMRHRDVLVKNPQALEAYERGFSRCKMVVDEARMKSIVCDRNVTSMKYLGGSRLGRLEKPDPSAYKDKKPTAIGFIKRSFSKLVNKDD